MSSRVLSLPLCVHYQTLLRLCCNVCTAWFSGAISDNHRNFASAEHHPLLLACSQPRVEWVKEDARVKSTQERLFPIIFLSWCKNESNTYWLKGVFRFMSLSDILKTSKQECFLLIKAARLFGKMFPVATCHYTRNYDYYTKTEGFWANLKWWHNLKMSWFAKQYILTRSKYHIGQFRDHCYLISWPLCPNYQPFLKFVSSLYMSVSLSIILSHDWHKIASAAWTDFTMRLHNLSKKNFLLLKLHDWKFTNVQRE